MYQTVGQDAIHLVAEALEVPLYRKTIKGKALNQDLEYGSREALATIDKEDETEDLFALLSTVKVLHLSSCIFHVLSDMLMTRKNIQIFREFQLVLYFPTISALVWNMFVNASS